MTATTDEPLSSQTAAALSAPAPASAPPVAPVAAAVASPAGAGKEKKRRARGKNFQAQEDLRLCATWLRVSEELDGSTRDQPQQQDDSAASFWERACDVFNGESGTTKPGDPSFRSYQSLQSRWSALQATIATFGEIVDQVRQELLSENKGAGDDSGETEDETLAGTAVVVETQQEEEEELLKKAQLRYAERHPKRSPFPSLPCWEFLRNTLKWQRYVVRSGKNSARSSVNRALAVTSANKQLGVTGGAAAKTPESEGSRKRRANDDGSVAEDIDAAATVVSSKQTKRVTELEKHTIVAVAVKEPAPVVVAAAPSPAAARVVKGGGFLSVFSPPTAFANEDQVVQWTVRENRALPDPAKSGENGADAAAQSSANTATTTQSFALFDDSRRIETLVGGEYELNLYLEPQGNDESKYCLEINGNAVTAFRELQQSALLNGGGETSSRRSSIQPLVSAGDDDEDGEAIPFKTANVARVQLNKWDMLALRRKAGSSSASGSSSGGKTPFARFIIEFVR